MWFEAEKEEIVLLFFKISKTAFPSKPES